MTNLTRKATTSQRQPGEQPAVQGAAQWTAGGRTLAQGAGGRHHPDQQRQLRRRKWFNRAIRYLGWPERGQLNVKKKS